MAVVIKPSGPVVGLDIGSSQIKIAEARATKNGIQLTGLAVVPTPEDLYIQGTIIDPKKLGIFIKKLLASRKISAKNVVSAISGQSSVVVRIIEMSKMSDKELKDTMKWEVERHVPFAANDVEMDYVPIPNPTAPPDAQTMEVLLVVAQRESIKVHLDTLTGASLNPNAIDVAPLAIGRSLVDAGDPLQRKDVVAVVNIGLSTTDINIFRDGTLAFTRPMPLAGDTFTRAIADTLGKTPEEAELLKREHASILLDAASTARNLELDAPTVAAPTPEPEPEPPAPAQSAAFAPPGPMVDLSMPLGLLGANDPPIPDDDESPSARGAFDLSEEPGAGATRMFDLGAAYNLSEVAAPSTEGGEATPESIYDLENIAPAVTNLGNGPVIIPPDEQIQNQNQAVVSLEGLDLTQQIFHAIQPVLTDFVTELRRSLDYFRSRSGGEGAGKIILCGGGARLPNLDTYLARELNLIVDVASLGPRVQCTYKNFTAKDLEEALPVIPVCLGLAIRDMIDEDTPKPKAPKAPKAPKPPKAPKAPKGKKEKAA